jgi:hypothetical protein
VLFRFDHPGCEALAEEMAPTVVAGVETLRVLAVQHVQRAGDRVPIPFDDEVVVVVHEAVGMDPHAERGGDVGEYREEPTAVDVVVVDLDLAGAAGRDVEETVLR